MGVILQLNFHLLIAIYLISTAIGQQQNTVEPVVSTFDFYLGPGTKPLHGLHVTKVTYNDTQTVILENMNYDGKGPKANWIVGIGKLPKEHPGGIDYPGIKIPNEKEVCSPIEAYNSVTIVLHLPKEYTFDNSRNLTNVIIPDFLAIYSFEDDHIYGSLRTSYRHLRRLPDYTGTSDDLPYTCVQPRPRNKLNSSPAFSHARIQHYLIMILVLLTVQFIY